MNKLTVRQQANRILKWYCRASIEQVNEGMKWYNRAQVLAVELADTYGVSTLQAATVISLLSPQKKWDTNKQESRALFNEWFNGVKPRHGYFATKRTLDECKLAIRGYFTLGNHRIKTYSFADNIAYTDSEEVTIDRHALRVAYDDTTTAIDKVSRLQYLAAREAYRKVALTLGIRAYQLQAIVWVTYKAYVNR